MFGEAAEESKAIESKKEEDKRRRRAEASKHSQHSL
jgi:hypothetical protein